jgi:deoxycytidylate deaminase
MPNSQIAEILDKFKNDPKTTKLTQINKLVHVAVIVSRGKIIAEATNRIGYRPQGESTFYNTAVREKRNIHAEENVVRQLGDYNKLRDADMYVMRYGRGDKNRTFVNSKPCPKCECFLNKCIKKYGLRNIYYTTSEETDI